MSLDISIGKRPEPAGSAPPRHLWTGLLGVASCCLVVVFAVGMALMLDAAADAGQRRARDRAPRLLPRAPGQAVVARWMMKLDSRGERQYPVIHVQAATAQAAPPPGLPRWPRPGEVFVSAALLEAEPAVRDRYGSVVGTVSPEGLTNPAEWLVYVGPQKGRDLLGPRVLNIYGFGDQGRGHPFVLSSIELLPPRHSPWLLALPCSLIPAAGLACCGGLVVARTREHTRVAAVWIPIGCVLGSLLGGLTTLFVSTIDVPVPMLGYVVSAADAATVRHALPSAAAAGAVAGVSIVAVAGALVRSNIAAALWRGIARVAGVVGSWSGAVLVLLCCLLAAAAVVVLVGRGDGRLRLFDLIAWATIAVGLMAQPAVFAGFTRWLRAGGPMRQAAGLLIAGGDRSPRPGPGTLMGLSSAVVLAAIALPWLVQGGQTVYPRGRRAAEAVGAETSILVVRPNFTVTGSEVAQFQRRLSPDAYAFAITENGGGRTEIAGTCEALASLAPLLGGCPTRAMAAGRVFHPGRRTQVLTQMLFDHTVDVRGAAVPGPADYLLVQAGRAAWPQVKRAAHATLPQPVVERPGESWLTTGWQRRLPLGWTAVLLVAVLLLLMPLAAVAVAAWPRPDIARPVRARWALGVAGWALGAPICAGGLASAGLVAWLQGLRGLAEPADGLPGWSLAADVALVVVTAGLATVILAARLVFSAPAPSEDSVVRPTGKPIVENS